MNLPNKITFSRIILTIIILSILLFPFDAVGIALPSLFINESMVVDLKYFIAGVLFVIAIMTDILDGQLARKYQMETKTGKIMDDIADKILINSILLVLSTCGFISVIIPLVSIITDIINYSLLVNITEEVKVSSSIKKIKNLFMHIGVTLTLFYNLPFELINLRVADVMLMIAAVLNIVLTIQFYENNKKLIKMQ